MATVDNDGRRRRYKPGPKNGINDMGRSQEPLSNLHIELALKYMLDCHLYNQDQGLCKHWNKNLYEYGKEHTVFEQSYRCKPKTVQMWKV